MSRLRVAFALLLFVFASLGGGTAIAKPIDQSSWPSLKKEVRLPNGVKLAYVELGNPKGQPVLLLHGYTDTSRSWSLVAPYLDDYRLLIPDQRGHGAAEAPACCYSMSNYAHDARLLLDALGIQRAAVAGHSMGSMVAMTMAAEYPEQVSKIVLIGRPRWRPSSPAPGCTTRSPPLRDRWIPARSSCATGTPRTSPLRLIQSSPRPSWARCSRFRFTSGMR